MDEKKVGPHQESIDPQDAQTTKEYANRKLLEFMDRADKEGFKPLECTRQLAENMEKQAISDALRTGNYVSDEELLAKLKDCPESGLVFKHYTGHLYRVIGSAICERTLEPVVVYRSLSSAITFVRPLSEWNGQTDGVNRYTLVGGG